jgi:hypothetical protein
VSAESRIVASQYENREPVNRTLVFAPSAELLEQFALSVLTQKLGERIGQTANLATQIAPTCSSFLFLNADRLRPF